MISDPITGTILSSVVGKKVIEQILVDLYTELKIHIKTPLEKLKIKAQASTIDKKISELRQVKTLWQVDKSVDLKSFYCDSYIIENGKRSTIKSISDIKTKDNILIEGIAGQGKSILLRYLCSTTLAEKKLIPIFIELRKISSNETIINHIIQYLEILNLKIDELLFSNLAKSGKFILFLDGFDEVSIEQNHKIIHEIEHIGRKFEDLRIIVTSRPDSTIKMLPQLTVIKLDNYKNNDYQRVINKLSMSSTDANQLIYKIEHNKANIKELLCTPLMVTLLVISYKFFSEVPEQLSDFYNSLFTVLLQRHDGVKAGYKRVRKCLLNDTQYRKLFEGFCYESKKESKLIYNLEKICKFAELSLKNENIKEDPEKFVDDIIKVTCLVLKEGNEYRFIHRSVQEYYTASYIKNKPEPIVKQFYNICIERHLHLFSWAQELIFLSEIDNYRYKKYFMLPLCLKILQAENKSGLIKKPTISEKFVETFFNNCKISFTYDKPNGQLSISSIAGIPLILSFNSINLLVAKKIKAPPKLLNKAEKITSSSSSVKDLYEFEMDFLKEVTGCAVEEAFQMLIKVQQEISREEDITKNLGLDFLG